MIISNGSIKKSRSEAMAKDDYHILAYRLLAYLYACLKAGETPQSDYVQQFEICESYRNYLLENLSEEGYIKGVLLIRICGQAQPSIKISPYLQITPKGIEYLQENAMMKKAFEVLKELKSVIPGI